MEGRLIKICLSIYIISSVVRATGTIDVGTNETVSEDRHPRVVGRIVKLYSGAHPEPVYCSKEGFQADPLHCAIFYRCIRAASGRYTIFRFQCGPGTIYDPDVETCNFPQRTKRTNCGGFRLEQAEIPRLAPASLELPSPIFSKPFYGASVSDSATNTASTLYPWVTTPSQKLQSPLQKTSTASVWKKTAPQSLPLKVTAISQDRQGGDPCIKDGFMGDSQDCRKFYRCVGNQRGGFIRYEFSCSDSTVWDDDAQSCNHAWAVQRSRCGRTDVNYEDNHSYTTQQSNKQSKNYQQTPKTEQQQVQINYGNKVSQTQTQISHGPVTQNQTQINYGDRDNTNLNSQVKQNQTQVSYGSAVSQTQTQLNHGNNALQTQLQIDHTKDSSQTQTTINNVDTDDSNQGYGNQPVETSNSNQSGNTENDRNECTESGFMGDSTDCKRFYRCVDNGRGGFIKYDFTCGEGTVWDPSIESCNHAWAVPKCSGNAPQSTLPQGVTQTTTTTTVTESPPTPQGSATTDDYEDPGYNNQNPQQEPSSSTVSTSTTELPQTSIRPSEVNQCKSSGFMGDKNNCKIFYRCVDNGNGGYTRYEFSCGEGTVWDSKIEACNHVWAVEKCGEDDSDIYKETTSSARPTSYDEMPEPTSDSESGYPGQPSAAPDFTDQQKPTSKPTEQQPTKKTPSEKECTQEGFVGDEEDCKKFYRCVNNGGGGFTKYEFNCGEGTVWDSDITACNHPNSVKKPCSGETLNQTENISETPQEASSSGTQTSNATEEAGTTEKPLTTKPSFDKECSQEGFMGDDSDCKKFYRCVDNGKGGFIKYEFSCGEGTVWDSKLNTCNHQSPSCGGTNSQGAIVSTEPERQDDETHTEISVTQATEQITTTQSTQQPQYVNDKCTSEGFFGDSNDCKKFYRCVDDGKGGYTKYDFNCGDGTIWDQELQTCDHESSNTNCSKGFSSDSQTNQLPTETAGQESLTSTGTEEHVTQKPYPPQNESRGKCSSEGFYANPDDCKKFYRCADNGKGGYTKYDFSCGDGTVWVQEIQACDHDTADTCSSSQNEQSLAPENGLESQPTSTSTESATGQPPDKQEDEKPEDSVSNNDEKCTSEGYYANKEDCREFYRCVDNGNGGFTKYDFTCGEGTAWDSDLQTCNHIEQVESCQGQENQSKPELGENTTTTSSTDSSSQTSTSGGSSTESSRPVSKDKCEQEGFYGHSQDCTKFYRCVDNGKDGLTKYDFTCGEGTIWDQDVQTCNHPQDVANPSCQQSAGSESSTSSSTTSSSSLGSSGTTSSTTEGNNGSDCSTKKPANKNVNCTKAGYYPDSDDCKKFYRCVDWDGNGEKFSVYHFECGEGTIWDPALDTCNHKDSVYPPRDCSGSQSQSENVNEETTTSQTTTTSEQSTTEQTTTEESITSAQTIQFSDQTTTEQSTDATTAQQTEQSTTEQTTAQQSTTSRQTEPTTTHQTTTQQTEESTTEQSTTSKEQTTTQQTTEQTETMTTHQTTTQQTEDATTEQSATSSEQTTTQQTTEQTETMTTQQITTQQTEDSTTEQSATSTEQTTEQTTTQESTTSESTTEQSTTEHSSTSTTESSTQETTEGTTQESITEHLTTAQTDDSGTTESFTSTTQSSEESTIESSGDQTTESSSSEKECPKTEDDQNLFVCPTSFKRHPKYCNMFYQCTEDDDTHDVQVATFRCPNETIYDERQTKCVEEKKAEKECDGEMAQKRRIKRFDTVYKEPITITNERLHCPAPGHYPFEKENCSPAFLKCKKNKSSILRGYVYQCPQNYVYWSVSRRCEHKDHVRDCKKSYNDWSGRWEIPIERRNVAP